MLFRSLPRWRGAAPIQWAIAEGDPETGVCLMRMEAGLDTGPVLATARTPIHPDDTSAMLHDRLANLGAELLVQGLPRIASGQLQPVPQPAEGVTYARKISREDGRIDWNQPAEAVARRARAFSPWPGSFCTFTSPNSHGFSILKVHVMDVVHGQPGAAGEVVASSKDGTVVACACDAIRLVEVQPEGGRRMPAHAFMAGHAVLRFQ